MKKAAANWKIYQYSKKNKNPLISILDSLNRFDLNLAIKRASQYDWEAATSLRISKMFAFILLEKRFKIL